MIGYTKLWNLLIPLTIAFNVSFRPSYHLILLLKFSFMGQPQLLKVLNFHFLQTFAHCWLFLLMVVESLENRTCCFLHAFHIKSNEEFLTYMHFNSNRIFKLSCSFRHQLGTIFTWCWIK
jgi:hypothetical protein